MSIYLMTQPDSLRGMNLQSSINQDIGSSQGKLVTGKRINKAADDAAGLSILTNLETKILSITQALRNNDESLDLFSRLDVEAEQMQTDLLRMRQLSIYANSGAKSDNERMLLNLEYSHLSDRVQNKATNTSVNGVNFHSPSPASFSFQFGTEDTDQKAYLSSPDFNSLAANLVVTDISTQAGALDATNKTYNALDTVVEWRQEIGLRMKFFESNITSLENLEYTLQLAKGGVEDTDMATQAEKLTASFVKRSISTSMLAQVNNSIYQVRALVDSI